MTPTPRDEPPITRHGLEREFERLRNEVETAIDAGVLPGIGLIYDPRLDVLKVQILQASERSDAWVRACGAWSRERDPWERRKPEVWDNFPVPEDRLPPAFVDRQRPANMLRWVRALEDHPSAAIVGYELLKWAALAWGDIRLAQQLAAKLQALFRQLEDQQPQQSKSRTS